MEYKEQLIEWFEKYEDQNFKFEDLEKKYNKNRYVSALVFLSSKLKDKEKWFLHAEHEEIYIGDIDKLEELTEEDVIIACYHSIHLSDYGDSFVIYT